MADLNNDSIATCIQALKDAIRYYDMLCQSETVDSDDYAEARDMYMRELGRLIRVYRDEEKLGRTSTPLSLLLKDSPIDQVT